MCDHPVLVRHKRGIGAGQPLADHIQALKGIDGATVTAAAIQTHTHTANDRACMQTNITSR